MLTTKSKTKKEQKKKDFIMYVICILLFFLILITFGLVVLVDDGLNLTSEIILGFLIIDVICINRLILKYMYD